LYVSSIAVRFPNKTRYYYAQSKEQAEQLVRSSGLRYTILRPTIILGQGSPVWAGLCKLASLPVIPIFGDGKTLIQPIHVQDLVRLILAILDRDLFRGDTLELGGPEAIAIEEFLKKVHHRLFQNRPRTMHISLAVLLPMLTFLELILFPFLPITVGQLASFRYNGTTELDWLSAEQISALKSIDAMVAAHCAR
jgi:NADH dehydrogenase